MKKLQDELLLNKVRRGLEESIWGPRTADVEQTLLAGLGGCWHQPGWEGQFFRDGVDSDLIPSTSSHQEQLLAEMERMQMEIDQLRGRPPSSYSR